MLTKLKALLFPSPYRSYFFILLCAFFLLIFTGEVFSLCSLFSLALLKFTAILLCLVYSAGEYGVSSFYTKLLSLTCAADFFLLFTEHFFLGVALFCLVQLFLGHFFKMPLSSMVSFGLLGFLFLSLLDSFFFLSLDPAALLSGFYLFLLLHNCFYAWKLEGFLPGTIFTLFLLCDIHVGVFNLSSYLPLARSGFFALWREFSVAAIWAFYLPGQILFTFFLPDAFQKFPNQKE